MPDEPEGVFLGRGARVFQVDEDGTEVEITEIMDITVKIPVDGIITAEIITFLSEPKDILAKGRVFVVCPECSKTMEEKEL